MTEDISDNKTKIAFKGYYESLSRDERVEIRDSIISSCEMNFSTFYGKLQGNGFFRPLEIREIERICNQSFDWGV
ncbi:MAG: hypothetical protein LBQ39_07875 [Tannerellaceae bacterium]|jgi:hypothetical protein|nr:hypothetical protein [Tannerellaceae bacterium]